MKMATYLQIPQYFEQTEKQFLSVLNVQKINDGRQVTTNSAESLVPETSFSRLKKLLKSLNDLNLRELKFRQN